jgi:hypothetical protein
MAGSLMHQNVIRIAELVKSNFLDLSNRGGQFSVFLCGGSGVEDEKLRKAVGKRISRTQSKYEYTVYYPEDMFIDLILGHKRQDLLTLENLLARSVDAVTILVQSPGTFAELGAFSNIDGLKNKLVVVIDPKYEKARSFVNLGPVRLLKDEKKSRVIYTPLSLGNIDNLSRLIIEGVRAVAKNGRVARDLTNPIASYEFYLALICIFDPIPFESMTHIASVVSGQSVETVRTVAKIAVGGLLTERKVFQDYGTLSITPIGLDFLLHASATSKREKAVQLLLSDLRIKAINVCLRKNYRKIWGEVPS